MARQAPLSAGSGRRGYIQYQYGGHFWIPILDSDWSRGMVRDTPRVGIPQGSVYDSADYLLHQPGIAQKRGGTSYAGPALTGAAYVVGLAHVPFASGPQLLAIGSNGHLFKVTSGTTTDIGALGTTNYGQLAISPGGMYLVIGNLGVAWQKYDGASITTLNGGGNVSHFAVYKSRLVGGGGNPPNRLYFSQATDVNASWDTSNSYIDTDHPVSGFAALNNALLVFSSGSTERIIGATPPPNSDMDRAPLSPIGCTDHRSIVVNGPYVFFANPEGIYMTNGSTPVSLTEQGGISTYWRSLFTGYVTAAPAPSASTWTISATYWRGHLFVCVLDASRNVQATLMCNVARRAWWRLSNVNATAWVVSVDGNELYYADGSTNRVVAMSGIFSPATGNKNDANGTAVTPTIEFRAMGTGTGVKQFGFGRLSYDMRDAASDNPTMAVTVKKGIEADTSSTPTESPLVETTSADRKRFTVSGSAQSVTIALAQTNASSKTELYALEVDERGHSNVAEGIS